MNSEDKWEFIYSIPDDSPEPETSSRESFRSASALRPVSVRRKTDGKTFSPGNFVLLESSSGTPFVGVIHDFLAGESGALEVRTVWFTRPWDILPGTKHRPEAIKVGIVFF